MTFIAPSAIDLCALALGTPALSPAMAANLAEAAVVCLTQKGHLSGVNLSVERSQVAVQWATPDLRAGASHADQQDATEEGAVAIAIQLIRGGTDLDVVRRSRKGTGFDYYLAPKSGPPFAETACLEVSGILNEASGDVEGRLKRKLDQVERGGLGLPGYAVVVGFRQPHAAVRGF